MKKLISFAFISLLIAVDLTIAQDFVSVDKPSFHDTNAQSQSVSMVDVDGDGWLDIYISNGLNQANRFYKSTGDGNFTKVENSIITSTYNSSSMSSWVDFDQDGDLDLYVLNSDGNNSLYRQEADGSFSALENHLLTRDGTRSLAAAWGDYTGNGQLDLYVANGYNNLQDLLYKNMGDGNFEHNYSTAVTDRAAYSWYGTWNDIDNDGDLDLYITRTTDYNTNLLFENKSGALELRTNGPLLDVPVNSRGASWGDFDNDGDDDLFVANARNDNALFENKGEGTFEKKSNSVISNDGKNSTGSCWADFNNDGYLDLYVANGSRHDGLQTNNLYMNNGDGTFSDVQQLPFTENADAANGVACGDYNNDGFVDIFVVSGGDEFSNKLYRNEGNDNNWLIARVNKADSARPVIGTKMRAKAEIDGEEVWQYRTISSNTGLRGQSSFEVEFGLGNATIIDSLAITFPQGGKQVLTNVEPNQYITITQESLVTNFAIGIDEVAAIPGDTAVVPIKAKLPSDSTFTSFETSVDMANELEFVGIDTTESLLSQSGWIMDHNKEDTTLNVSAAGDHGINGSGKLFGIKVVVPENTGGGYDLNIESALFNTDSNPQITKAGSVFIPPYGDIDYNERIQAYDASIILKYLIDEKELTETQRHYADVTQSDGVSALDASMILQYTTGSVDSLPVENEVNLMAAGSVVMSDVQSETGSEVVIPIELRDGENIYAISGKMTYDSNNMKFLQFENKSPNSFRIASSTTEDTVRFVAISNDPIKGDQRLLDPKFEYTNKAGKGSYTVALKQLRWNENDTLFDIAGSKVYTDIEENESDNIPESITLRQNFPNPFNPSTQISYSIPKAVKVTLEVYSVTGQQVEVLVNNKQSAGTYQVTFDARNLSSGTYIYRLKAGEFEDIKQMMFVK